MSRRVGHAVKGRKTSTVTRGNVSLSKPDPPKTPQDLEEIKAQFLRLWADPLDARTELEFAEECGVTVSQIRAWRLDPAFYEPATEMFQRSFRSNLIPIVRNLLIQAVQYGSIPASKTLLEMLGFIKGTANVVVGNINVNGGSSPASLMTDEELERDMQRLSLELYPSDIKWNNKGYVNKFKVLPVSVNAIYEEIPENIEDEDSTST